MNTIRFWQVLGVFNPLRLGLTLVAAIWVQGANAGGIDTTGISDQIWEIGVASERIRATGDNVEALSKVGVSLNYGLTAFWATEIGGELSPDSQGSRTYTATAWTNKFLLPAIDDAWPGLGILVGYSFSSAAQEASILEIKLIADKTLGAWTHAINLGNEQSLASRLGKESQFTVAYTTRWGASPLFSPAIEIYKEFAPAADADGDEGLRLGPTFSGSYSFGKQGSVNYETGYLYGATGSPSTTLKAKVSYSVAF